MKSSLKLCRNFLLVVLLLGGLQSFAQTVHGIQPDKNAKPGTWTEWQSVKDTSGAEIAQYRVRFAGSKKFAGNSVECKYEVEVKSMTDHTLMIGLDFDYRQSMYGNTKNESGRRTGTITKKGKSWVFEFSLYTDKGKDKVQSCFDCDMSYELNFGVSKY